MGSSQSNIEKYTMLLQLRYTVWKRTLPTNVQRLTLHMSYSFQHVSNHFKDLSNNDKLMQSYERIRYVPLTSKDTKRSDQRLTATIRRMNPQCFDQIMIIFKYKSYEHAKLHLSLSLYP